MTIKIGDLYTTREDYVAGLDQHQRANFEVIWVRDNLVILEYYTTTSESNPSMLEAVVVTEINEHTDGTGAVGSELIDGGGTRYLRI